MISDCKYCRACPGEICDECSIVTTEPFHTDYCPFRGCNLRDHGLTRFEFFLSVFLSRFMWVRRFVGGHWERFYVEECGNEIWHATHVCSARGRARRPTPVCRMEPVCENYP